MSAKPKVFIGCARENSAIMDVLAAGLEPVASVHRWTDESMFPPGKFILACLLEHVREFDFAVMLFEPADILISRGEETLAPRDNVVFELGLFMGNLEPQRVFVVVPRIDKKLKMLSDLGGLTPISYTPPKKKARKDLEKALQGAIRQISTLIKSKKHKPITDVGAYHGPTDVLNIAEPLMVELSATKGAGRLVTVRNIALDMEVTWTFIRDRILTKADVRNLEWRSVMIDPQSPTIRQIEHETVSTTTAAQRIEAIRKTLSSMAKKLSDRNIKFECRMYSSVPVLHGFLVNDSVLFLTLLRIEKGKLIGAPNAYWKFVRMPSHAANEHYFQAYSDWFNHAWDTGIPVWPLDKEK